MAIQRHSMRDKIEVVWACAEGGTGECRKKDAEDAVVRKEKRRVEKKAYRWIEGGHVSGGCERGRFRA